MRRMTWGGMMLIAVAACCLMVPVAGSAADSSPSFNRDIRPLLSSHCFECHGPDEKTRAADLRFDDREAALEWVIVPGEADESELIARLETDDPEIRMPPADSHKKPLTKAEIALLRRWIDAGAEYEQHWSFIAPQRPPLPDAPEATERLAPIDRFIGARLTQEGLQPAPEADRRTLIRRLSFDLTGLPPSPAEVEAFVADRSADAYEKVVDRLLASDRYGEHRARFWLDAARYADTNGYQYDLEREQWTWRDWVIDAFNTNMRFDQFTIEQMAGDLLPGATDQQRLATGFHRNHPVTIEGGVIDEEYRTEYVVDRVVTTSTVWLGMTMLCSRCHDHKYDPVSQKEFYQLFAFFNQVPERGLNGFDPRARIASPLRDDNRQQLQQQLVAAQADLDRWLADGGDKLAEWEQQLAGAPRREGDGFDIVSMTSTGGADLQRLEDGGILASGKNPATDTYELVLQTEAQGIRAIRLEALTHPSLTDGSASRGSNGNFVLSEFQLAVAPADQPEAMQPVRFSAAEADYSQKNYNVDLAIDGETGRDGWAVDGNTKPENRLALFTLAEPIGDVGGSLLRIRMIHNYGASHQIGRFRLGLVTGDRPPIPLSIHAILATRTADRTAGQEQTLRDHLIEHFGGAELREAAEALRRASQQLEQATSAIPATMVMAEKPGMRKTHVLQRGEYDKPGEEVSAGVPAVFPPLPEEGPRDRLGLAQWLVMPNHPLTARVTVNRFWQQLFGVGLVKTTEDFGAQGAWPTHPDLLDYLAVEFVESGWDVKALFKQIVMSRTYRQSSNATDDALDRNPENRLLARAPRLRLDAEAIRDNALAASGLLVEQSGGPSVFPYHPAGLWQEINNRPGYSRTYKQDSGVKLYRRSLYTFWKRTVPPPSLATFDAPGREYCVVNRSRTNTPLQAFVLLHDPQFVEAARYLAERMLGEVDGDLDAQIRFGFQWATSRLPTEDELALLREHYQQRLTQYRNDPEAAVRLLSVGDSPRDTSLNKATHAALTSVARLLLNLSESITKG